MKYDPHKHQRRSIRLQGYDYSSRGAYFITICTQNRQCLFGEIDEGKMRLTPLGKIVKEQWNEIPSRFTGIAMDEFIVMPNHIHGIINIVGAPLAGALIADGQNDMGAHAKGAPARGAPTVGTIIGAYKSLCVHHTLKWIKQNEPNRILGKLWQRNYYEHIIRDENELNRIRQYIIDNPEKWEMDRENLNATQQNATIKRNVSEGI